MNMLETLKSEFIDEKWEVKLKAADQLAEIGTQDSLEFLVNQLGSENNWNRNAAALGLRDNGKRDFFEPIFARIKELGVQEDIGTLVYALEAFDCSYHLKDICRLYFGGNAEVQMSIVTILEQQKFKLTSNKLDEVKLFLECNGKTLDDFKIHYEVIEKP